MVPKDNSKGYTYNKIDFKIEIGDKESHSVQSISIKKINQLQIFMYLTLKSLNI